MRLARFACLAALSAVPACLGAGPYQQSTTTTSDSDSSATDPTGGPVCGNGTLDPGEQCDDGNMAGGDGCENDCTTTPGAECGDGEVDPGEQCDDGNTASGDGCEKNCTLPANPKCGDGVVDPGELCDDGNTIGGDGCESNCNKSPICGDGVVDPGELCDDGNAADDDACLNSCKTAECGDGVAWAGMEACDDGAMNGSYGACAQDCSGPGPRCGDGVVNGPEECDDANMVDDDACSDGCIAPRTVFVTSTTINGQLGGLAGADALCKTSADKNGLVAAQWIAWLSDETGSPATRMDTAFTGWYQLPGGTAVAHGWTDLTDGTLLHAIDLDESGAPIAKDPLNVWSNTSAAGAYIDANHCMNWSESKLNAKGRLGDITATGSDWTEVAVPGLNPATCSAGLHVYCFAN